MPVGLRGLVLAAIVGAILSTISGLVNSTSTIVTLDMLPPGSREGPGRRLGSSGWGGGPGPWRVRGRRAVRAHRDGLGQPLPVRPGPLGAHGGAGRGGVPLRGPLGGREPRGAVACLWLAVLTVPLTLVRAMLADAGIHFLPPNLENPLVLAGAVSLVCWALMASLRDRWSPAAGWSLALAACVPMFGIAVWSPVVTAVFVAAAMLALVGWPHGLPLAARHRHVGPVAAALGRAGSLVGQRWVLVADSGGHLPRPLHLVLVALRRE